MAVMILMLVTVFAAMIVTIILIGINKLYTLTKLHCLNGRVAPHSFQKVGNPAL
ncbi:hypothetical protein D3C80_1755690 [compost metagenome]